MRCSLNGSWTLLNVCSGVSVPASVPGSIMNAYLEAGLAEDPFYRDNEYKAYELFRDDFIYSRTFEADASLIGKDSLELVCEGIDTLGEIFINGERIASCENMHRTYRIGIKGLLRHGANDISVRIKSPVECIEKAWREKGPVWGVCARDGYQFIRKAHYMFGWDWGPAIADGGIWRDIYIEAYDLASIGDVYISQIHSSEMVVLEVRHAIRKYAGCNPLIIINVYGPDGILCKSRECTADGMVSIEIKEPQLWWPAGHGGQPLYRVEARLLADGCETDLKSYEIGLRTLKIARDDDEWGQSFAFEINGVRIFAKGANYIPEDSILARCSPERTKSLVMHAVSANFNTLRVWGGGIYPPDYFFGACDRHGIIVWQDFMFACAQYVLDDPGFVDSIRAELRDNIRRLRHHASIALWCGNNEMEWLWVDSQTEGRSQRQKDEYLELFEGIIPEIAKAEDPDRFYWPASPSSGGGFDNPNDENRGDVHYWDVWHGLKPFTEYRKFYFRFCSEFGFQSFPGLKTVESFTLPEDRNIFSHIMESHQKNGGANGKILYYLSENFRYPKDFGSLLYVSQLLQAEAIKYGVEHWRRNRGRCMGSVYWQFNDCWPVASWSGVDSFQRWKALHYFARRFYSPVLLSVQEDGLKAAIHLSNESFEKASGEVIWKLVTTGGLVLDEGRRPVSVEALSDTGIAVLDYGEILADPELRRKTYLRYEFSGDAKAMAGPALLFVPSKHFEYDRPIIGFACREAEGKFILEIKSDAYAGYVEIITDGFDCVFSDNYFDLYPGESKTITVESFQDRAMLSVGDFEKAVTFRSIRDTY